MLERPVLVDCTNYGVWGCDISPYMVFSLQRHTQVDNSDIC